MFISIVSATLYLVQLKDKPLISGTPKYHIEKSQSQVLKFLNENIKFKIVQNLTLLTNTVVIDSEEQITHLQHPNIKRIIKSKSYKLKPFKPLTNKAAATDPHDMTGVKQAWKQYRVSGKGVKIGIVDTGIDYTHTAFGNDKTGCFGTNCRVETGFDFPNDKEDVMDILGHGTHVAGLVGGYNRAFSGVAPACTFGAYNVYDEDGYASDIHILIAIAMAYRDKMDIILISMGLDDGWEHGVIMDAIKQVHEEGIIVISSSGNAGQQGLFMTDSPGLSQFAISVGATDVNGRPAGYSSYGLGSELQLKPDISAPGTDIYSTLPKAMCRNKDCFGEWSGSDIASAYVAGIAALYTEYYKSNEDFKTVLINSALPISTFPVVQQGGGMVNIVRMIQAITVSYPEKLELKNELKSHSVEITNHAKQDRRFKFDHRSAVAIRESDNKLYAVNAPNEFTVNPTEILIESGKSARVTVTIKPNNTLKYADNWIYGGYIFAYSDSDVTSIPYCGFYGDYQSIPTFAKGYPKLDGNTLNSKSIPKILIRLNHPAEALQVQVLKNGKSIGLLEYQSRLSKHIAYLEEGEDYLEIPWVTEVKEGKCVGCFTKEKSMIHWEEVKSGTYNFKVIAQKAMGNAHNSKHYETWISPDIKVIR
eukprot:NODE_28_length_38599_cov_0.791792.p6 type:complete len:647 gc:universal NODE_28_length_38599_cov_0.791792:24953-23013(-)